MRHESIKIVVALVVAGVIASVGYAAFKSGLYYQLMIKEATGYITFTAHEEGTDRNYPHGYDVATGEFIELSNDSDTFYIQTELTGDSLSYIQAPYLERTPDDLYYPYEGSPQIVSGDYVVELGVINPSDLSKSSVSEIFTFHALSRVLTDATSPEFYFAPENYQDSDSWAIYVADMVSEEVTELAKGHSPAWSPDGEYLFYLSVDGVNVFEVATRMTWSIASLPERLPTPMSSLEVSDDGQTLYVLTTSVAISPDRLFIYDISTLIGSDLTNANLELKRVADMPEGKHTDLSLSPDENFASVVTYGEGYFELHSLNLQTNTIQKQTLFKWDGLEKYYHYPHASWTVLSPVLVEE